MVRGFRIFLPFPPTRTVASSSGFSVGEKRGGQGFRWFGFDAVCGWVCLVCLSAGGFVWLVCLRVCLFGWFVCGCVVGFACSCLSVGVFVCFVFVAALFVCGCIYLVVFVRFCLLLLRENRTDFYVLCIRYIYTFM